MFHVFIPVPLVTKRDGRLAARSEEASMSRDSGLNISNRHEIWQAHRQQRCRAACQNSEKYNNYNTQTRGIETSRDLAVRRLSYHFVNRGQVSDKRSYCTILWSLETARLVVLIIASHRQASRPQCYQRWTNKTTLISWCRDYSGLCNKPSYLILKQGPKYLYLILIIGMPASRK